MKRFSIILCVLTALVFSSCDNKKLVFSSCDDKKELYKQVDYFVSELDTHYEHYDALGKHRTAVMCGDTKYSVTPIGRLINVKIEEYVPDSEYEKLRKSLEKHYKGDRRVNDVYICQAGTVMVDCRN